MEKWIKKETEIDTFRLNQSSKIDDLDTKWERMMEKYKITKAENKVLKSKNEQNLIRIGDLERSLSNTKDQILELKERNRLLS